MRDNAWAYHSPPGMPQVLGLVSLSTYVYCIYSLMGTMSLVTFSRTLTATLVCYIRPRSEAMDRQPALIAA